MDVSIQTGATKTTSGTNLISDSSVSALNENVFFLLHVDADKEDAKTLEKEWKSTIKHSLLETEGDAAQRLDGVLKELNGLLKGFLVSQTISQVHAIIALLEQDGTLHVSHAGQAEAYLIRGGSASQITEFTRGKPTPAFVHISSGDLKGRDTVIFSSQRLLRTLTPVQLAQLAKQEDQLVEDLKADLNAEKEQAVFIAINLGGGSAAVAATRKDEAAPRRRGVKGAKRTLSMPSMPSVNLSGVTSLLGKIKAPSGLSDVTKEMQKRGGQLLSDLKDPKRKRKAHMLLLAGTLAVFVVVWAGIQLSTTTQRSQTKSELADLVEQIDGEITTAENRRLAGDIDSANAILERAEDRAKQVMDNESGYFRVEALDLLDRIRAKREEINNITRLSPRVVVSLATKNENIINEGFVGLGEGEFIVYDKQDLYRVLLNSVDDPDRLDEEELIARAVNFDRYQTIAFQMVDNSLIELINGQPTTMKTDDPAGWIAGADMETYLRFLYVLSPENNQIYKYERLSNRYTAPSEYNVNGDLSDALDMAIDGNVFVLKEGGKVTKLFRGEVRPFVLRYAPDDVLADATKVFKVEEGHIYFMDPVNARIVVATDGGATGEASYSRQYILEGDQIGTIKDIYVDPEETQLYVLDEKRLYAIDLAGQ